MAGDDFDTPAKKIAAWNAWRKANPQEIPQLLGGDLGDINLSAEGGEAINLRDADLEKANLGDANLEGADLTSANLEGAYLCQARLDGTKLNSARLEEADLWWASLKGATLSRAHLERTNMCHVCLEDADLSRAHLEGADLSESFLRRARFSYAHLKAAGFGEAQLEKADLRDADLTEASFFMAKMQGAFLERACLERALLDKANLEEANLTDANLKGAIFTEANFNGAKLQGANFDSAVFQGVCLDGVSLQDVNLNRANLLGATKYTFDETRIGACRYNRNSHEPWLILRRKYTGPNLIFVLFFLSIFLIPYAAKTIGWVGINRGQQAALGTIEQRRASLTLELGKDPLAIAASPEALEELSAAQRLQVVTLAEMKTVLNENEANWEEWQAWQLIIGVDRGWWPVGLTAILILVYNAFRFFLTWRVGSLRYDEELMGSSPPYNVVPGIETDNWRGRILHFFVAWMNTSRRLFWLHIVARVLFWISAGSGLLHLARWLLLPVKLPG